MKSTIERRDFIRIGCVTIAGALLSNSLLPLNAFATEKATRGTFSLDPKLKISVLSPAKDELYFSKTESFLSFKEKNRALSRKSSKSVILDWEVIQKGNYNEYIANINIPALSSYVEEEEISSEDLEVNARVALGVLWGEDKNTIQIQRGTFSVTQKDPLVPFYNTSYAMMQKSHYMSDFFNGKEMTKETNWPIDPYNPSTDQHTCGGAVIGGGNNILTGEEFAFAVELYL